MFKTISFGFMASPLLRLCATDPSVFLRSFSVHPFPDVGRAVNDFDSLSATGIQKPNCIDINETQFVQIQSHLWAATLDLGAQVVQLLTSKFTANSESSAASHRNAFNPQRHLRSGVRAQLMQR